MESQSVVSSGLFNGVESHIEVAKILSVNISENWNEFNLAINIVCNGQSNPVELCVLYHPLRPETETYWDYGNDINDFIEGNNMQDLISDWVNEFGPKLANGNLYAEVSPECPIFEVAGKSLRVVGFKGNKIELEVPYLHQNPLPLYFKNIEGLN
jgi:hypothetical protein